MATKRTRLTQKLAIQLHIVVETCTICSLRSRPPVRKLLNTPSYVNTIFIQDFYITSLDGKRIQGQKVNKEDSWVINGLKPVSDRYHHRNLNQ
jgi:hypothetical protein